MEGSSPRDGHSAKHRLPVNPRRHKVAPDKRKRVTTACNSCNVRRVKCSGQQPCNACAASKRECVYPAVVEKVQVEKAEFDAMRRKIEVYEKALQEIQPDAVRRTELLHQLAAASSPGSTGSQTAVNSSPQAIHAVIDERDAKEATAKLLYDSDGTKRFVGETSGPAFLDRIKELIDAALKVPDAPKKSIPIDSSKFLSSLGEFHTFSTIAKFDYDVNPLTLPPKDELQHKLSETRHVFQDGNGSWPSGGIYWYGRITKFSNLPKPFDVITANDLVKFPEVPRIHASLALHVFACCRWPQDDTVVDRPGDVFFARAARSFQYALDGRNCSVHAISALALMATYLLEETKRDAAYMHISSAVQMCIILGIHRMFRDESTRRLFWTVYCLDRWIGCVLGRPPMISDDAIQVGEPEDDPNDPDMPNAAGLRAHIALSRISGHVVCNMYRIAPFDGKERSELAQNPAQVLWMLDEFKRKLPPTLQLDLEGTSSDEGTLSIHMRANQLIIIATRPLFLIAVKKALAERMMLKDVATDLGRRLGPLTHCIEAARHNFFHTRQLALLRRYPRPSHQTFHYVFTATTCLIMEDLVYDRNTRSAEELARKQKDIDDGIALLQEDEKHRLMPINNSCVNTLHDLTALVNRLVTWPVQQQQQQPPSKDSDMTSEESMASLSLDPDFNPPSKAVPNGTVYGEIATWMDNDWLMQNNYVEH